MIGSTYFGLYCRICCVKVGSDISTINKHLSNKHGGLKLISTQQSLSDALEAVRKHKQQSDVRRFIVPDSVVDGFVCNNCSQPFANKNGVRKHRSRTAECRNAPFSPEKIYPTLCGRMVALSVVERIVEEQSATVSNSKADCRSDQTASVDATATATAYECCIQASPLVQSSSSSRHHHHQTFGTTTTSNNKQEAQSEDDAAAAEGGRKDSSNYNDTESSLLKGQQQPDSLLELAEMDPFFATVTAAAADTSTTSRCDNVDDKYMSVENENFKSTLTPEVVGANGSFKEQLVSKEDRTAIATYSAVNPLVDDAEEQSERDSIKHDDDAMGFDADNNMKEDLSATVTCNEQTSERASSEPQDPLEKDDSEQWVATTMAKSLQQKSSPSNDNEHGLPNIEQVLASTDVLFAQVTDKATVTVKDIITSLTAKFGCTKLPKPIKAAVRERLIELITADDDESTSGQQEQQLQQEEKVECVCQADDEMEDDKDDYTKSPPELKESLSKSEDKGDHQVWVDRCFV